MVITPKNEGCGFPWWFFSTHLKQKYSSNWIISPGCRGKKYQIHLKLPPGYHKHVVHQLWIPRFITQLHTRCV